MTKAKTRGQRRRRRQRQITLHGDSRPNPARQGARKDLQDPADAVALAVRARLTGCTVEEARDTLASEPVGRCIRYQIRDDYERRRIFEVWQGMRAAWETYIARCYPVRLSPAGASLPFLPEEMSVEPSLHVETRTLEERVEEARNNWFQWLERIMSLPTPERHAVMGQLHEYGPIPWDNEAKMPTRTGQQIINGLQMLVDK
ncbi:MAG: hypothetical protein D6773_18520 [Alphaproteobacteria bacterium]|nr:MAG: hypothetical protein D6773_18520 [Alphaproteobacteria bacterium]